MHLCSHPLRFVVWDQLDILCGIRDLMSRKSCIENSCVPDILLCYLLSRCNIHCKLLDRIGAEFNGWSFKLVLSQCLVKGRTLHIGMTHMTLLNRDLSFDIKYGVMPVTPVVVCYFN